MAEHRKFAEVAWRTKVNVTSRKRFKTQMDAVVP